MVSNFRLLFLLISHLALIYSIHIPIQSPSNDVKLDEKNETNFHGWLLHLTPPEDYIIDYDDETNANSKESATMNPTMFETLEAPPAKVFRPEETVRSKREDILLVQERPIPILESFPSPLRLIAIQRISPSQKSMAEIEQELVEDFPTKAPLARGLFNIPEGHNLDKDIDGDFRDSVRLPSKNRIHLTGEEMEQVEIPSKITDDEFGLSIPEASTFRPFTTTAKNPFEDESSNFDKIAALQKEVERQQALQNLRQQLAGGGSPGMGGMGTGFGRPGGIGVGGSTGVGVGPIGVGTSSGLGIGGLGGGLGGFGGGGNLFGIGSSTNVGVGPFGVGLSSGLGIGKK